MIFNIVAKDEVRNGKYSLKRVIAGIGCLALTAGFGLMAYKGALTSEAFFWYPLGLTILYAPQLAITLLQIWKGQINGK